MRKFAWQLNSHTGCSGPPRSPSRIGLLTLLLLAVAVGVCCDHLWR